MAVNSIIPNLNAQQLISLDDDEIPKTKPLIERLTMPEEFQHSRDDSKSDDSNSLYESGRDFNLNHGKPIDIDPHFSKIFRRQLENDFQNIKDAQTFKDFSSLLEKGIHGKMHTYIGGGFAEYYKNKSYLPIPFNKIFNRYFQENEIPQYGLMASVESAGFDPIFWLHHANIDRLWAQWTNKKDIHVSQQELEQVSWPYQFFETSGEAKGYTMQEVHHAVYNTDYNYDDISIPNYSDNDKSETKASSPPKTTLGENNTTTTIGRDKNLNLTIEVNNLYRELLKSLQPNNGEQYTSPRLKLDVNVTYTGKPRGLYEIYLNLPKDQSEKNEIMKDENTLIDTYLVGGMTFFVLDSEIPKSKKFTFSISDILYKQINNFSQFNPHSVSIEINQEKTRVNDRLTVDSIVMYAQN